MKLFNAAAAAAKSLQSCLTLCNPIDGSPPGSPVPGILQARTLEWVAISFPNALKWKVKVKSLSRARLLATPWTAAYQAPSSMGFSRQELFNKLQETIGDSSLRVILAMFLYISLQEREIKINKWSTFVCTVKESINKTNYPWENIFIMYISNKGLLSKNIKDWINLILKNK